MNKAASRPMGLNVVLRLLGGAILSAAALAAPASSNVGQEITWRDRAPLSLARAGYMAAVIRGKYVIAGGSYWRDKQKKWTDEVDVYNPVTDSWSRVENLPEAMSDAASVAIRDKLYLFGGGANDTIRRGALVLQNGKWQALPSAQLPEPRLYSVAVADRGLVYILGGLSKHGDYTSLSNKVWVWNPRIPNKGWKEVQPLPGPGLMTIGVAASHGKIYVLGGAKAGGTDVVNVDTAYEYDPRVDKWVILPPLPISRRCWWGQPEASNIYLFGGYTSTNETDIFSYNTTNHNLTKIGQMPHGLCDAKFFRIGNSIYGVGGESAPGIRGRWTLEGVLPLKR